MRIARRMAPRTPPTTPPMRPPFEELCPVPWASAIVLAEVDAVVDVADGALEVAWGVVLEVEPGIVYLPIRLSAPDL